MWQRFTEQARRVILLAQQEATHTLSISVESEHLLLGMMAEPDTIASRILAGAGVTKELVRLSLAPTGEAGAAEPGLSPFEVEQLQSIFKVDAELVRRIEEQLLRKLRPQSNKPDLKLTVQARRVLEVAADEARRMQLNYIGPEHLLLGILRQEESAAATLLNNARLNLERTRELVLEHMKMHGDEAA